MQSESASQQGNMKGLVYTPLCLPLVSGADTEESPLRDSGPDTEEQTSSLHLPLVSGADTEEQISLLSLPLVPGADTKEQTSPLSKNQETNAFSIQGNCYYTLLCIPLVE